MGIRGISIGSILLVLLIVLLIFGTKRLKGIGSDLAAALKSFRKGIDDSTNNKKEKIMLTGINLPHLEQARPIIQMQAAQNGTDVVLAQAKCFETNQYGSLPYT